MADANQQAEVVQRKEPEPRPVPGVAFSPLGQNMTMQLRELQPVNFPVNSVQQIAPANPSRVALYICPVGNPNVTRLSPFQSLHESITLPPTQVLPWVIHTAQYPLLCQSEWWAMADGTDSVRVFEVVSL